MSIRHFFYGLKLILIGICYCPWFHYIMTTVACHELIFKGNVMLSGKTIEAFLLRAINKTRVSAVSLII